VIASIERDGDIDVGSLLHRVHKSALGFAIGATVGGAIFLLTAIHVALQVNGLPLGLLNQYFAGYDVSWRGAFAGLAWGFMVGFVAGWMLGFVHNFTMGFWVFIIRTKHDMARTRNFLDHL
jgi:hypothetical protein